MVKVKRKPHAHDLTSPPLSAFAQEGMPQDDDDDDDHGLLPGSSSSSSTIPTNTTTPNSDLSLVFAALQQKCGSGSIPTPLSAFMMLNRWGLALGRPRGIPEASMARKATVLSQQMSPSPSLRAETETELLGCHDARSGGGATPFMYDIPLLPLPSQPPPTPAAGPSVKNPTQPPQPRSHTKHFSDSRRYINSRAFYARQNADAFEAIVPYGVTTNTFIVDAYVRCILAYLADVRHHYDDGGSGDNTCSSTSGSCQTTGSDGLDPVHSTSQNTTANGSSRPKARVYIIELAAGHCLFGYLLAKRLLQAQEEGTLSPSSCWSICVLMTDFNQALLESRMNTPWMQPLVAAGLVEFAVLDAASSSSHGREEEEGREEAQPLMLLGKEKRVLAPGSLRGPVFVTGNYALDSFPVDKFVQSKTQGLMEVMEEEETGRLTLVPSLAGTEEGEGEGEEEVYPYQSLLQALVGREEEGVLHVVNVGFIRLLQRIRELLHTEHKGHLALLVADGTFQHDDPTWRVQDVPGEKEEEQEEEEEEEEGKRQLQQQQQRVIEQNQQSDDVKKDQERHIQKQQHQQVKPSNKKRKRKLVISLPDMSPGPGSGCFALAMDPQAVVAAALWALSGEEKKGKEGNEEGERWLTVRNTVVEGSLTVTLLARTEERKKEEGGREGSSLPRTREAFWRHVCLQNPTDFEHLQGLVLEEHDGNGKDSSGTKSLVACLGFDGMLALLRWSGYDGDLFLALRWPLRDALLRCHRPGNGGASKKKEDVAADVVEVVLRCLSNRMVLSARAWAQTRYWGVQFLYALGCYREAVAFFVSDCGGPASMSSTSLTESWKEEYNDKFGSAAEAFLVSMSLTHIQTEDAATTAHQILMGVMEGQKLQDGKGHRRIENYLKKQQPSDEGNL